MRSLLLIALVFVVAAAFVPSARAGLFGPSVHAVSDRQFAAPGATALSVSVPSGDIRTLPRSGDVVHVRADLSGSEDRVRGVAIDGSRDGNREVITIREPGGGWFGHFNSRYTITYPAGMALDLHDSSGDVTVENPQRDVTARDSSGDILIRNARSTIDAHSSSGDVTATVARGWSGSAIDMGASSGDVRLTLPPGFRGTLTAHTSSGDVRNRARIAPGATPIRLNSSSGDVTVSS